MKSTLPSVTFEASPQEQLKQLEIGVVEILNREELLKKLEDSYRTKQPLKVKFGADPTRSDLHLGHTVVLNKLRQFQDLGHWVQFIIGDFTAMIGDPTGRNQTRPPLTMEEIEENAQTYAAQVFKILNPERTTVYYNSHWLGKMTATDMIRLSAKYTVARLIEREDFQNRYRNGIPISLHEFLYPLCQGYDSVYLESDVELGGTDQTFNLLVGRELQKSYGLKTQQVVMTCPLLEGIDGVHKMSKSFHNTISIVDPPREIFGKTMRISDDLMFRWYEVLLLTPPVELTRLKNECAAGKLNPRDLKIKLAQILVSRFHSNQEAQEAAQEFHDIFVKKGLPHDLETVEIKAGAAKGILDLLVEVGLTPSKGEGRRLIQGRAVEVNHEKIMDDKLKLELTSGQEYILKVGKKKFLKIKVI
ncbi:MAG: tyrosine--tRNA ligase [Bdellovibrionaceae bacterium]|nr:tyrosine--tRNA ligase [Pseudobdellovibrionaceae bacterium]MDW8190516.1 tyrosine--tRNA ligase [Pseudobdellovibrionaceae bacterium]